MRSVKAYGRSGSIVARCWSGLFWQPVRGAAGGGRDTLRAARISPDPARWQQVSPQIIALRLLEGFEALIAASLLVRFTPRTPGAQDVRGRPARACGAGDGYPHYDQAHTVKKICALTALTACSSLHGDA